MAKLTQWTLPPVPIVWMFMPRLITRPWRSSIYFARYVPCSFSRLMMGGATPKVVEWPIPGAASFTTGMYGLVLGPNGTAWACLAPNSWLVELEPSGGLVTRFFGLAGAPYDAMLDLEFDGRGGLWYAVGVAPDRPAIGMFDRAGVRSFVWELPADCSHPLSIWPERNGAAVWFACYGWGTSAGRASFGRLDPAAGTVDYWSAARRESLSWGIAAEPASNATNVWFGSYDPLPNNPRIVRFNIPSGTFYDYTAPTFWGLQDVDLDRGANAWVGEGQNLRFIRNGANCGVTQFQHHSAAVTIKTADVDAREERVTPIETPVSVSVSTLGPTTLENCFENYSVGPASPGRLAIDGRLPRRGRRSIYFTDLTTNTIGRLDP